MIEYSSEKWNYETSLTTSKFEDEYQFNIIIEKEIMSM